MSADSDPDFLKKGVVANAKTVGTILMSASALSGIIILVKLTGEKNFKFSEAEFPVILAGFPFALFTIAHWYAAKLLVNAIEKLKASGNAALCHAAWQEVTATGSMFVRGAVAAMKPDPRHPNIYQRDPNDPSTIFTRVAVGGIYLAIIPFDLVFVLFRHKTFAWSQVGSTLILLLIAWYLVNKNWEIGGDWLVRMAKLSKDHAVDSVSDPAVPTPVDTPLGSAKLW